MKREPSILLLQARRDGDPARRSEVASFATHCGVGAERIVPWDLMTKVPSLAEVERFDCLMIGGSGDCYVSKRNLLDFDTLFDLIREVCDAGHPTFASCFGFQCLVEALGGRVVHDPKSTEVGTFDLRLTEDGAADEIFASLPAVFAAQLGRKDRAVELPDGALHLASSERCPYQAIRLPCRPIWATQFHPELDVEANRGRFLLYREGYEGSLEDGEFDAVLERFRESPHTRELLPRFLSTVFG